MTRASSIQGTGVMKCAFQGEYDGVPSIIQHDIVAAHDG